MYFKPDDFKRLDESQKALDRIREQLPNVWKGGDVAIEGTQIVEPGQERNLKILISKKNLPPIEFDRGVLGYLKWSVRSFLAQSGVDITLHKRKRLLYPSLCLIMASAQLK